MSATARCRDMAPLLAERAAGQLIPKDEAVVAVHLDGCERCRAAAVEIVELIALARASAEPVGEAELTGIARGAVSALRRAARRAAATRRAWEIGFAVAVAAALVGLAPVLRHRQAPMDHSTTHRWVPPDPEALWKAAAPPGSADDDGEGDVPLFAGYEGFGSRSQQQGEKP